MAMLDILILAILLIGLIKGWLGGFFRQLASMVGFFLGLVLAFALYSALGEWLAPLFGGNLTVGRLSAFILIWLGIPLALSLLAFVLTKAVNTVSLGGLNRLGGAVLGGGKYLLFMSCLLNVVSWIKLMPDSVTEHSCCYAPTKAVAGIAFDLCKPHVVHTMKEMVSSDVGDK